MKLGKSIVAVTAPKALAPKSLNASYTYSVRNVAATIAQDTMSYYRGNVSDNPIVRRPLLRSTPSDSLDQWLGC
jgi:outer membrane scaffolding protein for murein synthesis (MipA/OmpV family)